MLNGTVKKLINEQITKEFYSAYLYVAIADFYEDKNLDGFANWFMIQAQEERDHALMFRQYLIDQSEPIEHYAIDAPSASFNSLNGPLDLTLSHERGVTASINAIYSAAHDIKDFKTMQFLDWFIKEQIEEEKSADDLIKKFWLYAADGKGLYLLNSELGTRVYTPAAQAN